MTEADNVTEQRDTLCIDLTVSSRNLMTEADIGMAEEKKYIRQIRSRQNHDGCRR